MASVVLTPRETTLMRAVMANAEITVSDWAKVANEAEFKTAKYARDTWTGIKKKLATAGAGEDGDDAAEVLKKNPKAKATPKRKAAAEGDETETPTKKTRGRKKAVKEASDSEEGARGLGKKKLAPVKQEVADAEMGAEDAEGAEGEEA